MPHEKRYRPRRKFDVVMLLACSTCLALSSAAPAQEDDDMTLRDYYSGNGLLNRGMHEMAATEYRKFLSNHGDHAKAPTARYGLGVCLYHTGQFDAAAKELGKLTKVKDFEFGAEVHTLLGQCSFARGDYAKAAASFEKVVRDHSQHDIADDAAALQIESFYRAGQFDDVSKSFESFVRHWPDPGAPQRERVTFFAGSSLMGLGDYGGAAERFSTLLERFPDGAFAHQVSLLIAQCHHRNNSFDLAKQFYRAVLKQDDHSRRAGIPDALLGLGVLLQKEGRSKQAAGLMERLLNDFAESSLRSTALLHLGQCRYDSGDYQAALAAFSKIAPDDGEYGDDAAYWSARCKIRLEQFVQAARKLKDAIEKHPSSSLQAEMNYDLATALLRTDDQDSAVKALESFVSKFTGHKLAPEALYLLAVTEHQRKNFGQSQAHCRQFNERFSDHEKNSRISYLEGENEYLTGRYQVAARLFEQFLSRYPGDDQAPQAGFRLGMALYHLQRYDQASEALARLDYSAETRAAFAVGLLALGDMYFQRGEWKRAEEYLQKYLAKAAKDHSLDVALLKLGLAQLRQNKCAGAIQQFDRLLEQFETSPQRLQTLFERGQAYLALDNPERATVDFERVLSQGPESRFAAHAANHLGAIAASSKSYEKAADYFGMVVEHAPADELAAEGLLRRAQSLMAAQQFKAAADKYAQFLAQYPKHERAAVAQGQLIVVLARLQRFADVLTLTEEFERRCVAAGASNQPEPWASSPRGSRGVGRSHRSLIRAGSEPALPEPALVASVQYEKAWALRHLGKQDQVGLTYRKLIEQNSDAVTRAHALLELAEIEGDGERFNEAVALLQTLDQLAAESGGQVPQTVAEQGAYRLGMYLFKLERFEEAATRFESFINRFDQSPLVPSASFFCGEAYYKSAQHSPAVKHLTRVVEQYPSDETFAAGLLRLGECLAVLQKWARSEQVFGQYLDRFPDGEMWFQARFGVGWARENQSRYDEAVKSYRQVVDRHRGETAARAQFQIGECLYAQKQYEHAVRELLKVDILYNYSEWSAAALYEAGRCFQQIGQPDKAREQFKQVAERYPRTRWAQMASQNLDPLSMSDPKGG